MERDGVVEGILGVEDGHGVGLVRFFINGRIRGNVMELVDYFYDRVSKG